MNDSLRSRECRGSIRETVLRARSASKGCLACAAGSQFHSTKAQVPGYRRRHIQENPLLPKLKRVDPALKHSRQHMQAAADLAIHQQHLDLADAQILEVGQN